MNFATFTGLAAGLLQLWGYWTYNRTARHPNVASWAIWGLGSVLTFLLYGALVEDWVKEFLPFVCMLAALFTFIACLGRGLFGAPDKRDWGILLLDVIVVAYWIVFREATWANLLLQVDVAVSFVPTFRSLRRNPASEDPRPWLIWSGAYTLLVVTVVLRWENWWELLYPVNYLLLHAGVWAMARFGARSWSVGSRAGSDGAWSFDVRPSPIHGIGLFAARVLERRDVAFEFSGRMVQDVIESPTDSLRWPDAIGISHNLWLEPSGAFRHVNHSCEPNLGIRGQATFVALRRIEIGEELTFDYSISEADEYWKLDCRCGTTACRGKVRSIQYLPPIVYAKYLPYVPEHFACVYEKTIRSLKLSSV